MTRTLWLFLSHFLYVSLEKMYFMYGESRQDCILTMMKHIIRLLGHCKGGNFYIIISGRGSAISSAQ